MGTVILAVYVIIAVGLIGLILIQQGKGADAGANFGGGSAGGASESVFGSQGSGNFLTKTTAVLATLFFAIALFLSYLSSQTIAAKQEGIKVEVPAQPVNAEIPAIPGTAPPGDMDTITTDDKPSIPQ